MMSLFLFSVFIAAADNHAHEAEHHEETFEVSAAAQKTFGIQTQTLKGRPPWTIPASARVQSREENGVFRRQGHGFQRVDIDDLSAGDEIVVSGAGFLRTAEIAATEGAPEGHSH